MRLRLNKLLLIGDEKHYEVEFKDGLNFITGPISTGKSTILELIDYCLGKKRHKNYEEVRLKCKYVALDLYLNNERFLIERPLFSFDLPVRIYNWNEEEKRFDDDFDFFIVTIPKEENSLARFLQEKLEIPEMKLSGQTFSFRDLFKYCYVSQTNIDSENILDEKYYTKAFKRKPTLEIILNSLNQLLNELKNDKKEQSQLINELLDKKEAIVKFLRDVELFSTKAQNEDRKAALIIKRTEHLSELIEVKNNGKLKDDNTKSLEFQLFKLRDKIESLNEEENEIRKYITKLKLLLNQYSNEIIKLDYLILSNGKLQSIEFSSCPSCSSEIEKKEHNNCDLCGNILTEYNEDEEKAIKLERKRLNIRLNSLKDFIEEQSDLLYDKSKLKEKRKREIFEIEDKINTIQRQYISPFIEKIELLNRNIGELDKKIENLELSTNVQEELTTLSDNIQKNENKLKAIREQITDIENDSTDFSNIINRLSKRFSNILKSFQFPKLNNAYISDKNYLPYVRGTKYDEIGSLGAVTLVNIAYFLSILELSLELKKSYHPKVLLLDTVGKNLGKREVEDGDDEFRDTKIFKSVFKYLVEFSEKYKSQMQLFVINNDYSEDIMESDIIVQFDGDGTRSYKYGLIDDLIS
jgi:chromosome segregation ATPase